MSSYKIPVRARTLKARLDQEAETQSQTRGHAHHVSSPSPGEIAERLLELKHSNPELFTQAWKRIPQTTQKNIVTYLNRHNLEGLFVAPSASAIYEDKDPHVHKHKPFFPFGTAAVDDRVTRPGRDVLSRVGPERAELGSSAERPLFEWTDGELLAYTMLDTQTRLATEVSFPVRGGKAQLFVAAELRRISRQNRIQIVQNELIRRLLQIIAGKN